MKNDKEGLLQPTAITGEDLTRLLNSVDKQRQQGVNWWVDATWLRRTLPVLIKVLLKRG